MIKFRNYKRTVDPTTEPVTLAEAKLHVRIDITEDDTLITNLITAAREYCEAFTSRAFITQTYVAKLDFAFPGYWATGVWQHHLELPQPPLQSVTSVQYLAADGTLTTLDSSLYTVDTTATPGRIVMNYGKYFPVTQVQENAVTVTFVAGYGLASAVPLAIKQAILLEVGYLYRNRDTVVSDELPTTVKALLSAHTFGDYR